VQTLLEDAARRGQSDFDQRNILQSNIHENSRKQHLHLLTLQKEDYKRKLSESNASKAYKEALVAKLKAEEQKLTEKADVMFRVKQNESLILTKTIPILRNRIPEIVQAVKDYNIKENTKRGFKIFVALLAFVSGGPVEAFRAAIDAVAVAGTLIDIIEDIKGTVDLVEKMHTKIVAINLAELTGVPTSVSGKDYRSALKEAEVLILMKPLYDELENLALIQITHINTTSRNEIEGASEFISLLKSVPDNYKRLMKLAEDYAETLRELAKVQGDLNSEELDLRNIVEQELKDEAYRKQLNNATRLLIESQKKYEELQKTQTQLVKSFAISNKKEDYPWFNIGDKQCQIREYFILGIILTLTSNNQKLTQV
jgi:hypothetical protein